MIKHCLYLYIDTTLWPLLPYCVVLSKYFQNRCTKIYTYFNINAIIMLQLSYEFSWFYSAEDEYTGLTQRHVADDSARRLRVHGWLAASRPVITHGLWSLYESNCLYQYQLYSRWIVIGYRTLGFDVVAYADFLPYNLVWWLILAKSWSHLINLKY